MKRGLLTLLWIGCAAPGEPVDPPKEDGVLVIDNDSGCHVTGCFAQVGSWQQATIGNGFLGDDYLLTSKAQAEYYNWWQASWRPGRAGCYRISARVPAMESNSSQVRYGITEHGAITRYATVSARENDGGWLRLGTHRLPARDDGVVLEPRHAAMDGNIIADAMEFERQPDDACQ